MTAGEDVLLVLAHQDDEIGMLTRIGWERARGARVWCAYLTDGGSAVAPGVRDAESLAVLARAGVGAERIGFLADPVRIPDGTLAEHADDALGALRRWAGRIERIARVYTVDWEGGHHDHDAAHVVALAYARERGVGDVFAFPLYNGYRRRAGWFRVSSFVPGGGEIVRRRLSLADALLPIRAIRSYPSQRTTWLGLGPGMLLRALWRREERMRRAEPSRVLARPHPGPLLYETRFRVSHEHVMRATAGLRETVAAIRTS